MEEIKVGEYARTELGNIYSIIGKYERGQFGEICVQLGDFHTKKPHGEEWERHLKMGQLIDLIEEGDYVNGYKVDFVQNGEIIYNHNHPYRLNMFAKDIKSIVTKEQFQDIEYRLEE